MAIGIGTDFKIYNDQINGAMVEVIMQMIDAFDAASAGAITIRTEAMRGNEDFESFFTEGPDVAYRDPDDVTTDLTHNNMTQDEFIRVKIYRMYEQAVTRNQWLRIGKAPEEFSRIYGQQLARKIMRDQLNLGIGACNGALIGQAALNYDYSATGTLTHVALNSGVAKFGDAGTQIACFVMHSKPWYDLMGSAITLSLLQVGNVVINQGTTGTLGKPVVVTDSSSLVLAGTPTKYVTLALAPNAIQLVDTETPYTADQEQTGKANIYRCLQTEYAYNLGLRGFKWNTAAGTKPTNPTVIATGNWTKCATDNKSLPGVRILSQ